MKGELKKKLAGKGSDLDRFELLGADREGHRQVRTELWEEKLGIAAKVLGIMLQNLPAQRSAPEKVLLAAIMKAATSVSNGWLAERLQMGKPASVSQYARRFLLAGGDQQRVFKTALSRVKT